MSLITRRLFNDKQRHDERKGRQAAADQAAEPRQVILRQPAADAAGENRGRVNRPPLNRLEAAAQKTETVAEDFLSLCFQILYGLPTELQLRAAVHMRGRYLPIHEKKWPGITWPRQLLGDIDAWFRAHEEATPDEPDDIDAADLGYQASFTDLLCAYRYRDDPACLTGGLCSTMLAVVHVRAKNVFVADDPVASRLWKEHRAWKSIEEEHRPPQPESFHQLGQSEHSSFDNVAFDAVYRREWLRVVEWLRAEAVWKYPEPDDMDAMMRGLKRWEAHAFYSMGPERTDEPT